MMQIFTVFLSVFIAELGDKTQVATLLFSTEKNMSPWMVFLAASLALVLSTAIAVLLGTVAKEHLSHVPLKLIAGIGFITIGIWTIYDYAKG